MKRTTQISETRLKGSSTSSQLTPPEILIKRLNIVVVTEPKYFLVGWS
jgi:hypothetical protein